MTLTYVAVFAGKTKDGERIFLYRDNRLNGLHLKRGDGPLQALGPNSSFEHYVDRVYESIHLKIRSPQWIGEVIATRWDMVVEEDLDLPEAQIEAHIIRGEE